MSEFIIEDRILKGYKSVDPDLIIPDTATSIAFISSGYGGPLSEIETLYIPGSVKEIGPTAFKGCQKLKKITFEKGLETIKPAAFNSCTSLEEIVLPEGLLNIGSSAFSSCPNLKHVVIPSSVKTVSVNGSYFPRRGDGAFSSCELLLSVGPCGSDCNIEFGWEDKIPGFAFWSSSVRYVTIPDSIKLVGNCAFGFCEDLRHVSLPNACKYEPSPFFPTGIDVQLDHKIESKEELSEELLGFADGTFLESLDDSELAWIVLYQSKKWKAAVLDMIGERKALRILENCYDILKDEEVGKDEVKAATLLINRISDPAEQKEEKKRFKDLL